MYNLCYWCRIVTIMCIISTLIFSDKNSHSFKEHLITLSGVWISVKCMFSLVLSHCSHLYCKLLSCCSSMCPSRSEFLVKVFVQSHHFIWVGWESLRRFFKFPSALNVSSQNLHFNIILSIFSISSVFWANNCHSPTTTLT
jgi:hypothetical protein